MAILGGVKAGDTLIWEQFSGKTVQTVLRVTKAHVLISSPWSSAELRFLVSNGNQVGRGRHGVSRLSKPAPGEIEEIETLDRMRLLQNLDWRTIPDVTVKQVCALVEKAMR